MNTLGSDGLQTSAGKSFASQNDQPAGGGVLLPFCGELGVDKELELRQKDFKQTIYDSFKHRNLT
jgi:hypothetical protein